ncbi:MAG: aminotransferase class I/II-fold pyridoxal phosphate-dependent enzyme [Candidatus Melainabacteria bacterium]|nr:aminotransferase class I/II-fold pyridoxal phosphate-dependent enzyme [Candidatus Melainabacteria bacterium]
MKAESRGQSMSADTVHGLAPRGLARLASDLPVSGIRRFFDLASELEDVVSLGVGEPDFFTPWSVREAAIYAIEAGQTAYTANAGLLELRREISRLLERLYQVVYNPESEIMVTVGVSQGLDLACRTLLDPGDEVLVPEPCFVAYKPCVTLAGGVPVGIGCSAENDFRVSLADLAGALTAKTKAILLGYPANPTGATMSRAELSAIVDFACSKGLYIISDEIYDRLVYDGTEHTCVAGLPGAFPRTITLNGFSKAYSMTGWRLGYACAPPEILTVMKKIHSHTMMCAPTVSQKAAIEALKGAQKNVADMVAQYDRRRRIIVDGLNQLGLACPSPRGAFYAFPRVDSTGLSSEEFAERLLLSERVAVVPGSVFGDGGEGHIRCSYATSIPRIKEALTRIRRFLSSL